MTGNELLGVINSLGVRRSSSACEPLAKLVAGADSKVATAAILALGKIGNPQSEPVLLAALNTDQLERRSAAAEACVRLAEAYTKREQTSEAVRVCRAVRSSQAAANWKASAARAEIVADPEHRLERLVELLQADDSALFEMGLVTAREIQDANVTAALMELLPKLAADKQTQILHVLRDRADQQALPAVSELVQSASPQVQVAALEALGTLGNTTCLTQLVELHESSSEPTVRSAAWEALRALPGAEVNSALAELARTAEGQRLGSLIELVGERQMSAVSLLQSATHSEDQAIRGAAWLALGRTVEPKDLQLLIEAFLAPAHAEDRASIAAGLRKAAVRMPDSTITVRELANAIPISPPPTKTELIHIIADVEGAEALAVVSAAARGDEPALKETASAVLGKWRSLDAASILLEIAKTESANKYRVRALRGYIRIARQFDMTPADRVRMCEQALDAANRDEERAWCSMCSGHTPVWSSWT